MLLRLKKIPTILIFLSSQYLVTIVLRSMVGMFCGCAYHWYECYNYKGYYDYIIYMPWSYGTAWLVFSIAVSIVYFIINRKWLEIVVQAWSFLCILIFIIIFMDNTISEEPLWVMGMRGLL